jgi:hypothetical protein
MTNNIFISEEGKSKIGTYPVTLTIEKSGNCKLQLVKSVKFFTNLGLKDAKNLVDNVTHMPQVIKVWSTREEVLELKRGLSICDGLSYFLTDIQHNRNRKLIELGLGTKEDLVEELVERDIHELISNKFNYEQLREILSKRYDSITETELKKIMNI